MPTTADDLLYEHCWELALRFALDRKFRGDVDPIAAAKPSTTIDEIMFPGECSRTLSAQIACIDLMSRTRQPIQLAACLYAGSYVIPRRRSVWRVLFDLFRGR